MRPVEADLPFDGIHLMDRPWFPYLCTEVEHWEWESEGDAHYNFWCCLGGDGYLSSEGQTFRLKPGVFFIFSPNQKISAAHTSGTRVTRFSAHFIPLSGARLLNVVPGFPLMGGMIESLPLFQRQIDVIMRLAVRRGDDVRLQLAMYHLIARVCAGTVDACEPFMDPRISEAIRMMRMNPEAFKSIDELARELGWSRSHFDREFSKYVGKPPNQFLVSCRMVEARRFLENSEMRVGEIAERLGYRDIYFFSRQFKGFFGMSPAAYRQRLVRE
jgi:AraC-like DNA-binding protein